MSLVIQVLPDPRSLCAEAAEAILSSLRETPGGIVTLPSGPLARSIYAALASLSPPTCASGPDGGCRQDPVFDGSRFLALDEWFGPLPAGAWTTRTLLEENLLVPLQLDPRQVTTFPTERANPVEECLRTDAYLDKEGPVSLFFAEVDAKGRIGRNQPGTAFDARTHLAAIADGDEASANSLFDRILPAHAALTVGLGDLVRAKRSLVVGAGEAVGTILCRALSGLIDETIPCSVLRFTHDCRLLIDGAAASRMTAETLRRYSGVHQEVGAAGF